MSQSRASMNRGVNLWALGVSFAIIASVAPSLWYLRSWQLWRNADSLLHRADELTKESNYMLASEYIRRYQKLRPTDKFAKVRLAETYSLGIENEKHRLRAIEMLYEALSVAKREETPGLRMRLAELLLETERFTAARSEAEALLFGELQTPAEFCVKATKIRALAAYGEHRNGVLASRREDDLVGEACLDAIALNPADREIAGILALAYRERPELLPEEQRFEPESVRQKAADSIQNSMVEASVEKAAAHMSRFLYRDHYKLDGSEDDLRAAMKLSTGNLTVQFMAAQYFVMKGTRAQEQGRITDFEGATAQAIEIYERILTSVDPDSERAIAELGQVHLLRSDPAAASECWLSGLERLGNNSLKLNLNLANLFANQGRTAEANQHLAVVQFGLAAVDAEQQQLLAPMAQFIKAKIYASRGEYSKSLPVLRDLVSGEPTAKADSSVSGSTVSEASQLEARSVVNTPLKNTALEIEAGVLLGEVLQKLNNWEHAAAAYERVLRIEPSDVQSMWSAGLSWENADRASQANFYYQQLLDRTNSIEAWFALARSEFQRQLEHPEAKRNWARLRSVLMILSENEQQTALTDGPLAWRLGLLRVQFLIVEDTSRNNRTDRAKRALEMLRALEDSYPNEPELFHELATEFQRLGQPSDADRVVGKLCKMNSNIFPCEISAAHVSIIRNQLEVAQQLLLRGLEDATQQKAAFHQELFNLAMMDGRVADASEHLSQLRDLQPDNIAIIQQQIELALQQKKFLEAEALEQELVRFEGEAGPFQLYYRALRLLANYSSDAKNENLEAVVELQRTLKIQSPAWSKTLLLNAYIEEASGNSANAIAAYRLSIEHGEKGQSVWLRLVELLRYSKRFVEADEVIEKLTSVGSVHPSLPSLSLAVAKGSGRVDRALSMAKDAVERHPDDYRAHVWLGRALMLSHQTDDLAKRTSCAVLAEVEFKEALKLEPNSAEVWKALLDFYVEQLRLSDARLALDNMLEHAGFTEGQASLVRAETLESFGDLNAAELEFRRAAELAPQNDRVLTRTARFLLEHSTDLQQAVDMLRQSLRIQPNNSETRRTLATALVGLSESGQSDMDRPELVQLQSQSDSVGVSKSANAANWNEALGLLALSDDASEKTSEEMRLKAMLLVQRGASGDRAEAIRLLDTLVNHSLHGKSADQLMLARLYTSQMFYGEAERQYLRLVSIAPRADYLAEFVEFLLKYKTPQAAALQLAKLQALEPNSLRTTALRARMENATASTIDVSDLEQAAMARFEQLETPELRASLCLSVGDQLNALGKYREAEEWHREFFKLKPTTFGPLALTLARNKKLVEAIQLCRDASVADPSSDPCKVLASVLTLGNPTDVELNAAEPQLQAALRDFPNDTELLIAVAGLYAVQGRILDATSVYRKVVSLQPNDPLVLNNFASLLADDVDGIDEGLRAINKAISIAGPRPMLLDTLGMLYLHGNRVEEAVAVLEPAMSEPQADSRSAFHLWIAYTMLGNEQKAGHLVHRISLSELRSSVLTQQERAMVAELERVASGELSNDAG